MGCRRPCALGGVMGLGSDLATRGLGRTSLPRTRTETSSDGQRRARLRSVVRRRQRMMATGEVPRPLALRPSVSPGGRWAGAAGPPEGWPRRWRVRAQRSPGGRVRPAPRRDLGRDVEAPEVTRETAPVPSLRRGDIASGTMSRLPRSGRLPLAVVEVAEGPLPGEAPDLLPLRVSVSRRRSRGAARPRRVRR